jgi:hypothetical protein
MNLSRAGQASQNLLNDVNPIFNRRATRIGCLSETSAPCHSHNGAKAAVASGNTCHIVSRERESFPRILSLAEVTSHCAGDNRRIAQHASLFLIGWALSRECLAAATWTHHGLPVF